MSHITEEQGFSKDDSSEHISSLTGTHTHTQPRAGPDLVQLSPNSPAHEQREAELGAVSVSTSCSGPVSPVPVIQPVCRCLSIWADGVY